MPGKEEGSCPEDAPRIEVKTEVRVEVRDSGTGQTSICSSNDDSARASRTDVDSAALATKETRKKSIFKMSPVFRLRPSWNKRFGSTIKMLRLASHNAPKNITALRLMTDHSIPAWLPGLPTQVSVMKSVYPQPKGEWFYPTATGLNLRKNAHPTTMRGKYILYFHGGAFCTCSTGTHRPLLMRIVKETGGSVLAVDYRRPPEYPYPTPVDDCLSAYLFILEKTGDPSQIVLAGDSAGGNLVISTLLRIAEHGLASPAGAILLSPWVDLTDNGRLPSWELYRHIDYLPEDMARLFALAYLGGGSKDPGEGNAATSPLFSDKLHLLPPLLVEFGQCEVLHDQILQFCKKAKDSGVDIQYNIREDMVHVFPIYAFTGMQQCSDAFDAMVKFLDTTHPPLPLSTPLSAAAATTTKHMSVNNDESS